MLTTSAGAPIADNQNSITAGPRGPVLLQDYQLIEKLAHQNRERIPERTVHAKGWGAFGTFTVTHDINGCLFVQVMTESDAGKTPCNPFDLTKVWPHGDYPLIEAGILELNRNPENYFAEVEQAAFSPSNVVPGIGFSPDKMLQARIFSYADARRHRLGTHYDALPVNAPKCPVHNYHKDGQMRFFPIKARSPGSSPTLPISGYRGVAQSGCALPRPLRRTARVRKAESGKRQEKRVDGKSGQLRAGLFPEVFRVGRVLTTLF